MDVLVALIVLSRRLVGVAPDVGSARGSASPRNAWRTSDAMGVRGVSGLDGSGEASTAYNSASIGAVQEMTPTPTHRTTWRK